MGKKKVSKKKKKNFLKETEEGALILLYLFRSFLTISYFFYPTGIRQYGFIKFGVGVASLVLVLFLGFTRSWALALALNPVLSFIFLAVEILKLDEPKTNRLLVAAPATT